MAAVEGGASALDWGAENPVDLLTLPLYVKLPGSSGDINIAIFRRNGRRRKRKSVMEFLEWQEGAGVLHCRF